MVMLFEGSQALCNPGLADHFTPKRHNIPGIFRNEFRVPLKGKYVLTNPEARNITVIVTRNNQRTLRGQHDLILVRRQ